MASNLQNGKAVYVVVEQVAPDVAHEDLQLLLGPAQDADEDGLRVHLEYHGRVLPHQRADALQPLAGGPARHGDGVPPLRDVDEAGLGQLGRVAVDEVQLLPDLLEGWFGIV